MFEPSTKPRIYGTAPGVDFPQALISGLSDALKGLSPDAIARVTLFVNTRRMARRITELYTQSGATLLPRIRLVTDLAEDPSFASADDQLNPLARRLELAQLVRALIKREPDLAAEATAFDLADSLATLMEELHGEGVSPGALGQIDVAHHSAHWKRSLEFFEIVQTFFGADSPQDAQARQRRAVEILIERWQTEQPKDPIIIAGSTGSRGTTRLLMEAVSKLDQGAVILPGFDFEMTQEIWNSLDATAPGALPHEDHPQYRFQSLMRALDLGCTDIKAWSTTPPISPARNALVSLALRPAPVTDGWLSDGPGLTDLDNATQALTLLEAPTPQLEATAIALRLRHAIEQGKTAAVISPNRMLTRQITAALQRWQIEPDDSAGTPLQLTAPGRLLRQTAAMMGAEPSSETLLALLKHPLVGGSARRDHLRHTRDLELELLRASPTLPTEVAITNWATKRETPDTLAWVHWLTPLLEAMRIADASELRDHVDTHRSLTEAFSAGPIGEGSGELWLQEPGKVALKTMSDLQDAAAAGGEMTQAEYRDLLHAVLSSGEVRDPNLPRPDIMIWGTLEARVHGADLVILAGLNEGSWPELPSPDPWLNRQMRKDAGLLLPERRIGLSAHDFQQAIAAPEVWITRATRDAEAETVASRWINRLTNLMEGLEAGKPALAQMRARAQDWLHWASEIDRQAKPVAPAKRPAPQPPVSARPTSLSVTRIEWLIRDPYAIYARFILGLKPLGDLQSAPDAPLRGIALHDVFHRFIEEVPQGDIDRLMEIAAEVFSSEVPWPATRAMWRAKLKRSAPWFMATEADRRAIASPVAFEKTGTASLNAPKFTLNGRADRIDRTPDGTLILHDYKSGSVPSEKQQKYFNKQLPLLAAIAQRNGLEDVPKAPVTQTRYISLGATPKELISDYGPGDLDEIWADFAKLIAAFAQRDQGYAARRAVHEDRWGRDYDHLARYGEWDVTDDPVAFPVGPEEDA